jgi:hypothetical protein
MQLLDVELIASVFIDTALLFLVFSSATCVCVIVYRQITDLTTFRFSGSGAFSVVPN